MKVEESTLDITRGRNLFGMGISHSANGDYEEAVSCFLKDAQICHKHNDISGIAAVAITCARISIRNNLTAQKLPYIYDRHTTLIG